MNIELIGVHTEVKHLYSNLFLVKCECGCNGIFIYSLKNDNIEYSIQCIYTDKSGNNKIGYLHYICNVEKFREYLKINN